MLEFFAFDAQQTFYGYRDDDGGREPLNDYGVVLYRKKGNILLPVHSLTKLSKDLPYFPRIEEIIEQVKKLQIQTLFTFEPQDTPILGFTQRREFEDVGEFYSELSGNNLAYIEGEGIKIEKNGN